METALGGKASGDSVQEPTGAMSAEIDQIRQLNRQLTVEKVFESLSQWGFLRKCKYSCLVLYMKLESCTNFSGNSPK